VEASGDIRTLVDHKNYKTADMSKVRFSYLFNGCTSLTTAPEIPANTLVYGCYYQMFYGCKELNSVTIKAKENNATYAFFRWLNNVANTGTIRKYNV